MRVATFNLLHGVPIRDPVARTRSEGPGDGPGEGIGDGPGPHDERTGLVEPTDRHIWSPDVPDPSELVRAIEELVATGPLDVLALQEVDRHQPRTAGVDQVRIAAEVMGATHWRFVASVRGIPGVPSEGASWVPATGEDDPPEHVSEPLHEAPDPEGRGGRAPAGSDGPRYGIALLSRLPVRQWRVTRFPPAPVSLPLMAPTTSGRPRAVRVPDEPRSVVSAVVEAPGADITVATAHLSFVPGVNTRQLGEVRAFLAGQPRPMVMMGDFNTPGGVPGLVTGWHQVARTPTYPVFRPRVQFDHIMADGWNSEALQHARAAAVAMPLAVSDHCALVTEFPEP